MAAPTADSTRTPSDRQPAPLVLTVGAASGIKQPLIREWCAVVGLEQVHVADRAVLNEVLHVDA